MRTKVLLATSILGAFLAGAAIQGYVLPALHHSQPDSQAEQPAAYPDNGYPNDQNPNSNYAPQPGQYAQPGQYGQGYANNGASSPNYAPAPQPARYSQPGSYAQTYSRPTYRRRTRNQEALIVAGSAGAGTAIGAIAGGGKGAAIGALSGGLAGLVYDLATRNH